ncbi:hypothetical protein GQ472_02445 [archaeon]|nr:hypothetical protein [archaeon]
MACMFDKASDLFVTKTSLYNEKNPTELQCNLRDFAEYLSGNEDGPAIKHMLTYLSLATAALIGTNAGIKPEHTLSAAGLVALSDIAYHAITAGGDESFAGNGISPANP